MSQAPDRPLELNRTDDRDPRAAERGKELINQLFMLIKTCQIHDPNNQAFLKPLSAIRDNINEFVREAGQLTVETIEDNIYINEEKVRSTISTFSSYNFIVDEFEQKKIGGLRFDAPITIEDLKGFLLIFTRTPVAAGAQGVDQQFNEKLDAEMIDGIHFLEERERALGSQDQSVAADRKKRALKNYIKAIGVVKDSMQRFAQGQKMDLRRAKRIVYNLVDISMEESISFLGLSTIKNYDEYTFNHCVNVCVVGIAFGQNLGLSRRQLGDLGMAGLYHDFGKLSIPRELLNKQGHFNEAEWKIMRDHPLFAVKRLVEYRSFGDSELKRVIAAYEHHMNYDRSGYPQLSANRELNFYSRVVAICDAYDAMTTERVYQKAKLPNAALRILLDEGGRKFDPLLVKAFINTVGIYPVGSLVRLTTGDLAIVSEVSPNPELLYLPIVIVLKNDNGSIVSNGTLNLCREVEKGRALGIVNALDPVQYRINISHYLLEMP